MFVLLTAEIDAILKKKFCKRNIVTFFYSGVGKIIFALLINVVTGHMIISFINIE